LNRIFSKKHAAIFIKLSISIAVIGYLLGTIETATAIDRMASVSIGMLVASLSLLLLVQMPLAGLRWLIVLRAINAVMPYWKAVQIFMIGWFFNQVLPSSVGGDGVRIFLAHRGGMQLGAAVNGIMLERLATAVALLLLVVCTFPFLIDHIQDDFVTNAILFMSVALSLVLVVLMFLDKLPVKFRRWPIVQGLAKLAADTRRLFGTPRYAIGTLSTALVGHINVALATYVLAVGLDIQVSLFDCIVLVPPVFLVMAMPISMAGWGVREGAMVVMFGLINVPDESALALSLTLGIVTIVASFPGAVLFVLSDDRENILRKGGGRN